MEGGIFSPAEDNMSDDLYQEIILDHFKNPRNCKAVPGRTHWESASNSLCGDRIEVSAVISDGIIADMGIEVAGCAICKASGSIMTELVTGLSLEEAEAVTQTVCQIVDGAGPLPQVEGDILALAQIRDFPMRRGCALLAWNALKKILQAS